MLITVVNPFDGSDVEIDINITVNGIVNADGSKVVSASAFGTKEV